MDSNDSQGWVRPLEGESAVPIATDTVRRSSRSSSFLAGLVLVALVGAAVAGAVVWRNRNGDPFGSARAIPADVDYVASIDVLQLSEGERLQGFVDVLAERLVAAGAIDEAPGDLVAAFDEAWEEELGITLTDDVLPWIGRSASVAGTVPEFDLLGPTELDFTFIASFEVRDQVAARDFVEKVVRIAAEEGEDAIRVGETPLTYRFEPDDALGSMDLALTDGYLLFGLEDSVQSALTTVAGGGSVAEDALFRDAMGRLPSDKMGSFYITGEALNEVGSFGSAFAVGAPAPAPGVRTVDAVAGSAGLTDDGLLLSYVFVGDEFGGTYAGPDLQVVGALPEGTFGYLSVASSGGEQQPIDTSMFDQVGVPLAELEQQLGIDLVAILDSLSGSLSIAAVETREGPIARESEVPVGVVGAIGLNDSGPFADLLDQLRSMFSGAGVEFDRDGDLTGVFVDGDELVSYSLSDDVFVIGTGPELVGDIVAGAEGGLTDSELYKRLDAALIGNGLVGMIDIPRIVDVAPTTQDEAAVFDLFPGVGFGATSDAESSTMQFLLLIEY